MSSNRGNQARNPAIERVAGMNMDGSSDRPGSSQGRSRSGSTATGSQQGDPRSRAGSTSGDPGPYHHGMGYDPAKPKPLTPQQLIGKRVDLPPEAYKDMMDGETLFTKRPGFNSSCKEIRVHVNIYPVNKWPTADINQYDVSVTPNPNDSRALVAKVWHSATVQEKLKNAKTGWLFDGHKLAWNSFRIPGDGFICQVDLDKLAGKTPRPGKDSSYTFRIRRSTGIRMQSLKSYLEGQQSWDNHVLECMNFLDHLLRQTPSQKLISVKRCFYSDSSNRLSLDRYLEVRKGVYAAFRLSAEGPGNRLSRGLGINTDVANTAFWTGDMGLVKVVQCLLSGPGGNEKQMIPFGKMADVLRPVKVVDKNGNVDYQQSEAFRMLRRLNKLRIKVSFRTFNGEKKPNKDKTYTIDKIAWGQEYGAQGADSRNYTFERLDKTTGKKSPPISIFNYFLEHHKARLEYPDLPVIHTTRDGTFPMEACHLCKWQRYAFKLDPDQTSKMIKHAVTRPDQRRRQIAEVTASLQWKNDQNLRQYGVEIGDQMVQTPARLIANPEIYFQGSKINPGMSGRWDLRGKKFLESNTRPLVSWGFIGCGTNDGYCIDETALKNFATTFMTTYKGHGGKIQNPPYVKVYPFNVPYPEMCSRAYTETGKAAKACPQIIFFVLSTRNALVYERLKKNMDCRFCMVSQMLLADHVRRNNAQYHSNVAMKVNAKLGGITCKAVPVGSPPANLPYYAVPTMFIGMDVSHSAPGLDKASMAAMTMSMDKTATRYASRVQTNGYRCEVVQPGVMTNLLQPLLPLWARANRCLPQHLYYFRDGVAEGQFAHVLDIEIKQLKRCFQDLKMQVPRLTVVIATKRHHIRIFPSSGDRNAADKNNNPLPGTVVEKDATHPFHWDFFLNSHMAIQGTARPVHYQVILDEANCKPAELQRMLYHHCYQYIRSTTPVSLHPAVYYSHLASLRAASHEDSASSAREGPSGKAGFPLKKLQTTVYSDKNREAPPLLPMTSPAADQVNIDHMSTGMWFI